MLDHLRVEALGEAGHPLLEPALARAASRGAVDRSPLVLRELDGLAVAYRSDRTPPARVQRVSELFDLGDPVAAGDADQMASADLQRATAEVQGQERALTQARRERFEDQVRTRFSSWPGRSRRSPLFGCVVMAKRPIRTWCGSTSANLRRAAGPRPICFASTSI